MIEEKIGETVGSPDRVVRTVRLQNDAPLKLEQRPMPFVKRASYLRCNSEGKPAVFKIEEYPLVEATEAVGKKKSPKISSFKKEMRVLSKAAKVYFRHYKALAKHSDEKKREGARKDFGKNSFWASKKASEILRNESGLYNRVKFAKKLHKAVLRHQEKTLGKGK